MSDSEVGQSAGAGSSTDFLGGLARWLGRCGLRAWRSCEEVVHFVRALATRGVIVLATPRGCIVLRRIFAVLHSASSLSHLCRGAIANCVEPPATAVPIDCHCGPSALMFLGVMG